MEVRANTGRGLHYIITGHTLGSVKRNVLDPMAEMFGVNTKTDNAGTFELWGNKVHCFGSDSADSYKAITGMTAHGWYGNEVTLSHENTIAEAFSRISGAGARVFWDTNPDYPEHPVKLQYVDKSGEQLSSGQIRVLSHHFTVEDNPFLPADYLENLKATTPRGMWYDRRIKGLWVAAEGLVYELFDRNEHVVKPFEIPASWARYRSIDFGYTNPFVCLWGAVDHDGRLYIYDEHYEAQRLIPDHATAIKRRGGEYGATIADHDAQERAELASCGIATQAARKDVAIGIQRVAERLVVQKDGYPRLFITANCLNLIRELGQYAWEERKADKPVKEEPRKVNDHACLVAGTMVATAKGDRPIETILPGDMIWTRRGLRKAVASGLTNPNAEVVSVKLGDTVLCGTRDHLIFGNDDWILLDSLRYIDIIVACKKKPLSLKESNLGAILMQRIGRIESISRLELPTKCGELDDSMKRFGKLPMDQFPMVVRYIIKMAIHLIMRPVILFVGRLPNIKFGMAGIIRKLFNGLSTLIRFVAWPLPGMGRPLVWNGIGNTGLMFGAMPSLMFGSVTPVAVDMKQKHGTGENDFALTPARRDIVSNQKLILRHGFAKDAEKNLESIDILGHEIVRVNVHGWFVERERKPVYNLTVKDSHEFFANGVLVHNCDALRYLTMELDAGTSGVAEVAAMELGL